MLSIDPSLHVSEGLETVDEDVEREREGWTKRRACEDVRHCSRESTTADVMPAAAEREEIRAKTDGLLRHERLRAEHTCAVRRSAARSIHRCRLEEVCARGLVAHARIREPRAKRGRRRRWRSDRAQHRGRAAERNGREEAEEVLERSRQLDEVREPEERGRASRLVTD